MDEFEIVGFSCLGLVALCYVGSMRMTTQDQFTDCEIIQSIDNEARSAHWATSVARRAGLPADVVGRVYQLIMVTCHDATPDMCDEQILVDVDLAILGAEPERFDEYEVQVREEYAHIPGSLFRRGRRKILESFLKRKTLFSTALFVERYEARARLNLARSIEKLT